MNQSLHLVCRGRVASLLNGLIWLSAGCCVPALAQSVSTTGSLSFGTFVSTYAGTITVNVDGGRTQTGGVFALRQGGLAAAAQFSVHGAPNSVYAITLPDNSSVVLSDGAGHVMAVTDFVSSLNGTSILSASGVGQFSMGARLSVGSSQARGNYVGSFSVIVNYQ